MVLTGKRLYQDGIVINANENNIQQVGIDLTVKSIRDVTAEGIVGYVGNKTAIYEGLYNNETNEGKVREVELKDVSLYMEDFHVDISKENSIYGYILPQGVYSVTFNEGCKLPNNVSAKIVQRSSILRTGNIIMSSVYDPGFEVDNMGAMMFIYQEIIIGENARVAQIVCDETYAVSNVYNGQYQGNKDKK